MNITRSFNFWVTESTFFFQCWKQASIRSHIRTDHLKNNTHLRLFLNFSLATTLFFFFAKVWVRLKQFHLHRYRVWQTINTHAFKNIWPVWEIDYSQDPQPEPVHRKKVISLHSSSSVMYSYMIAVTLVLLLWPPPGAAQWVGAGSWTAGPRWKGLVCRRCRA